MSSHQLSSPTFSTLYCEEEHWDENNGEIIQEDSFNHNLNPTHFLDLFVDQNILCDDEDNEELSFLLKKEQENELYYGLDEYPFRAEAIEWMLKVIGYFSFSALTAVLAVNYLDKFLSINQSHREKPWMIQLAAVACLSLAAKVEEIYVPLLLDLQIEECKYLFESKTIQRMEILVLSTLQWRMNPVTPLSFLEYIAKRLALKNNLYTELIRRSQCLILSLISDCRFMCYLPSVMATTAMLYVISSLEPCICVEHHDQIIGILGIQKDKVEDCCKLIQKVATSVNFQSSNKSSFLCNSPRGVVGMSSFSGSDSSND